MESFDELGVAPELAEALMAEGIESPSDFQAAAIPVLLRGNPLLAQAGPGAGTLLAYGLPLLQRIDPEADSPRGLILAPGVEEASQLATSLSRIAQVTGHSVRALESGWALPERAAILFATPEGLLRAVKNSRVSLEAAESVVVDSFGSMSAPARTALQTLFEHLPKAAQRILLAQPLSDEAAAFGKAHFNRAVHLPPKAAQEGKEDIPPRRGEVAYRIVSEGREQELLQTVAHLLEGDVRHVVLFFRTEDQAADFGDFLSLFGYRSGAPGDPDLPVWLATEDMETRRLLDAWADPSELGTVSVVVPSGPDSLDRRHGGQESGIVFVRSRELPHLRDVARRTGYRLVPAREPVPKRVSSELDRLRNLLGRVLEEEDLGPYYLALEPLFQDHSPAEVAAAALALLKNHPTAAPRQGSDTTSPEAEDPRGGPAPKAWVRLFVAVGDKDGVGPGDLLGAIAGEAGVEGSQVGKIEIRETFSLVEVIAGVADQVVRKVNGTTIRGRSVRVDYDRGGPGGRGGGGSRGGRPQGRGPAGSRSGDGPKRRLKGKPPSGD